jgi:hypothetical protein
LKISFLFGKNVIEYLKREESIKNDWGIQFSHTIEEQIGGQLQAVYHFCRHIPIPQYILTSNL